MNKVILPAVNPVTEQWQVPISCSDTSAGSTHASSNYDLHEFTCAPSQESSDSVYTKRQLKNGHQYAMMLQ